MSHKIDTETLRCSCRAPMCFACGWCSEMCACPDKRSADERERDELERIRESDYDARAGTR